MKSYSADWDLSSIPPELLLREASRIMRGRKSTFAGGRPKIVRRCKRCGFRGGARELRAHRCEATG